MVIATNLKTSTDAVTKEQSKNMLKNAIITGISAIAYLRNLFEEDAFDESSISGLQLKTLKPYNSEAKLILDWLNFGVIDALEKEYLRLLVFGIHNETDDLIECYHFKFKYSDKESNMDISLRRGNTKPESVECKRKSPCNKDEAKQQTVQLLRALILLTQSLSPLPEIRYISMKLWYYDEKVPKDYEPNLFRPATPDEQLKFSEVPFECYVGKVDTGYHTLSIRVKSTADEDLEYEGVDVTEADKFFAVNGEVHTASQEIMETNYKDIAYNEDLVSKQTITGSTNKLINIEDEDVNDFKGEKDISTTPDDGMESNDEANSLSKAINNLIANASEMAKSAKYIRKEILASGLGIDLMLAKQLMNRLIEKGIVSNKLVRGKGHESKIYEPCNTRYNKRSRHIFQENEQNNIKKDMVHYISETLPNKSTVNNKIRRVSRKSN